MSHSSRPEGAGPTPQHFAAYVDGELGSADRAAVDAWLGEHPDARADVEAQRRLLRQWQAAVPPDPDETAWATSLARVEAGLATAARQRAGSARLAGVLRLAATLGAVAAVLVLSLGLAWLFVPRTSPGTPLPVATADDVEILSIEGGDVRALVVGEPPVQGPLTIASADDVTLDKTGPDVEVAKAAEHGPHGHQPPPPAPMIMFPTDQSRGAAP
jgi:anti-sigma factor RsiW